MRNRHKLVQEWVAKADNDLKNAVVLLQEGGTVDAVCFHSQQAVEKYLKAFLVLHKLPVKKIHSLVVLAKQGAQKEVRLLDFMGKYKILEAYYIESRYPPDTRVYTQDEGKEALDCAGEIINFIKKLIDE